LRHIGQKYISLSTRKKTAMEDDFTYLIDKIRDAPFQDHPFKHIEIRDFLSPEHLKMILEDDQIHFHEVATNHELVEELQSRGYIPIKFPGCTLNVKEYLRKLQKGEQLRVNDNQPIEGYGVAFRLGRKRILNKRIDALITFLNGPKFKQALLTKFGRRHENGKTSIITAIQKYLTGYEISPHCDIRRKCMTYLLNINRGPSVFKESIHTKLLRMKPERKYCYERWEKDVKIERCWVPWDWCNAVKEVSSNNTIVIFAPSNDTLHAVKLDYPHRKFQRTQIYGNLMYTDRGNLQSSTWKRLRTQELDGVTMPVAPVNEIKILPFTTQKYVFSK